MAESPQDDKEMSPPGVRLLTWCFLILGFFSFLAATKQLQQRHHYLTDAARAAGTVISTADSSGDNMNETARIAFRDADGGQQTFETKLAVNPSEIRKGQRVEVLYFPGVEGSAKALYEVESWLSLMVYLGFWLVPWFFAGLFVSGLKSKHGLGPSYLSFAGTSGK